MYSGKIILHLYMVVFFSYVYTSADFQTVLMFVVSTKLARCANPRCTPNNGESLVTWTLVKTSYFIIYFELCPTGPPIGSKYYHHVLACE